MRDFTGPAIAIIKHTNPCGLATAASLATAYPLALAGDPQAAYGGILAANRTLDRATAEAIGSLFLECIIAPGFEPGAMALDQRANLRLLQVPEYPGLIGKLDLRSVQGGVLVQQPDLGADDESSWQVVTQRQPTETEGESLRFAEVAVRHLKSNAIALIQGAALVGAGAGQMSRVDAVHMAVYKAGERARGAVLGSDAFFPFPDGLELAAAAGVTAAIQPGGSVKDADVIAAA